jgi:hypothetical protein
LSGFCVQEFDLWREAECYCQVAEFLLLKYKIISKSKFRASNTLLNSAEYATKRKVHFSFLAKTSCQDTATVTYPDPPSQAKYQCALRLKGPGVERLD